MNNLHSMLGVSSSPMQRHGTNTILGLKSPTSRTLRLHLITCFK